MQTNGWVAAGALALVCVAYGGEALAFGGSARELEHQGNFVITNNAGLNLTQRLDDGQGTSFFLGPALDYFVISNLSVGGAVQFNYVSGHPAFTQFRIAPEVGFEIAFSDTWSFWPQASFAIAFPNPGSPNFTLGVFAPFLVHPASHFFFGLGPGLSQTVTSPPSTFFTIGFIIGGYFDH